MASANWLVLCDQLDLCLALSKRQMMQHKSLAKCKIALKAGRQAEFGKAG